MEEDIGDQIINSLNNNYNFDNEFDFVIIGAGIAGCCTSYFLSKYTSNILLIDRNCDLAQGASGAAGAFLSPLLGKPNKFKDLVTKALKFSTNFYLNIIPKEINNCGVVRIPKNNEDKEKFNSYKPYMDFPFVSEKEGFFFDIGSQVNPYEICNILSNDVQKLFNYEIKSIKKLNGKFLLNEKIKTKKIIITTGADISLIDEKYFKIRPVWGQKIDIYTTTCIDKNYHKACSLSFSTFDKYKKKYKVSIGATHSRNEEDLNICNHCNDFLSNKHCYNDSTIKNNTKELIEKANDIKSLHDIEVCDIKIGPRASSVDYFPMVGKLIDSKSTISKFPHLVNGSFIKDEMLLEHDNIFVLNGVGGRGFVLSPYLAFNLVEQIMKNNFLEPEIKTARLFKRWVKKYKLNNY